MIKKVPVENLKVGVFIDKIDQSWFSTPFLFSQFKVTSEKQIKKLKDYHITEVYIDTQKGPDVLDSTPEQPVQEKPPDYIAVSTDRLLVHTTLPFDLYTLNKENSHSLYLRKDLTLHPEVLLNLEANGISTVYVKSDEKALLKKYEKDIQAERELSEKGLAPGFESHEKVKQYNDYLNNYMPIEPGIFMPGMKVPFNIYLERDFLVAPVFESNGVIPENEIFCRDGAGKTRKNLLLHLKDSEIYKNFLQELASSKSYGKSEEMARLRVAVVKENSKIVTRELINNPRSGKAIKEAKNTVGDLIENILENPTSFYGLMRISSYDYYTYLHSINVCTLATGLGMSLGLPKDELFELSIGALVHDVGKSQVASNLINKPGKLTEQEFIQVKNHVVLGYDILKGSQELSEDNLIPLLQHHEKLNGNGYPYKLEDKQLHLFGRISGIVDIYDALTTERSYKKAFKPFDAVGFLAKHPEEFDQEVFKYFVLMLGTQL